MPKKKIALAVDSTANLSPQEIEEYDIHVIPQILVWEGETYRDGVDITVQEFYQRLATCKELPTTSQPSAGEFHEFFKGIAGNHESIVGIFVSDLLSGTLDSARTAAAMIPEFPIKIVDSRSASMGLGFIALEAAKAIAEGQALADVVAAAEDAVPRAKAIFVVDTLEFLHRRGRIGGAAKLMGTLLSFKPLLYIESGRVEPLEKVRTKKKALNSAIEYALKDIAGRGPIQVSILHAASLEEARQFREEVKARLQPCEISIAELTPVLGTNTGPGLIGLAYITPT